MNVTISPRPLAGSITAIPSKSQAHRLLICAALSDRPTRILCTETNRDIEATVDCLRSLGSEIQYISGEYQVVPIKNIPKTATLNCCESGSTLRFMLPVAAALGVEATFLMSGRLPQRPITPLWEELQHMGCQLSRPTSNTLLCRGKLRPGLYSMDGSISSQFISGLLLALPLVGHSRLEIRGKVESRPYIDMTRQAIAMFRGGSPGQVTVEGDWSNAAFFLAAQALGSSVQVENLNPSSLQGDRAITRLLPMLEAGRPKIHCADIPDLVPILAVVAGAKHGALFTETRRLRLKESNRVNTIMFMIDALGGKAQARDNELEVWGTGYTGGTVDASGDHRIAMAAAIAATVCTQPVTITGAQAVEKSYPSFWAEYQKLGGIL